MVLVHFLFILSSACLDSDASIDASVALDHRLERLPGELILLELLIAEAQLVPRGRHAVALRVVVDDLLERGTASLNFPAVYSALPMLSCASSAALSGVTS